MFFLQVKQQISFGLILNTPWVFGLSLSFSSSNLWKFQIRNKTLLTSCKILPALIVWHIQKQRNRTRNEESSLPKNLIISNIFYGLLCIIKVLFTGLQFRGSSWIQLIMNLENMHVSFRVKQIFLTFPMVAQPREPTPGPKLPPSRLETWPGLDGHSITNDKSEHFN